ncbi:MAG TPA: cation diffusion facilitator family transporter [Marinospirillum sp.]|uniref:cation diffusion facilitator family transporter n=1 Tax=Marinospirillum sp. TaxID=2183934 RepID=UPI002B466135|nr:cation diffusion facilitator family transporter [Marinospirillum sp.]HKM15257.1 cation diffusion facilitator family transporter [Marinospirillum sp.]
MSENKAAEIRAANKITLIGMLVNALNALAKLLVGIWANSSALIADAIHSLSDLLSDILVLAATYFGRQKPDKDHPYGHDRYETLATLLLGTILIAVAGALVWDSISRLLANQIVIIPNALALIVAALSVLSKEWIYRYTLKIAKQINSKLLEANAWHHRTDALSSIVVFVAITGSLLGYAWLDQAAAIIVGVLVAKMGVELIWESLKELVDTALPPEETAKIYSAAKAVAGVRNVHHLRTRTMGSRTLLDIHLQVAPYLSVSEGHEIGVWVAKKLRDDFTHISDITFHIDPEDDAETDNPDPTKMLPLRPEIMAQLHQCWQGDTDYEKPHHITLHYLDLSLDVDLFYPADQIEAAQISAFESRLKAKAEHLPWLRNVKVWIGHISPKEAAKKRQTHQTARKI